MTRMQLGPSLGLRNGPARGWLRTASQVCCQQTVQARGRLGNDLRSFTSKLLVPGAGYLGQRPVQFINGAAIAAATGRAVVTAHREATGPTSALLPRAVTQGLLAAPVAPDVPALAGTMA